MLLEMLQTYLAHKLHLAEVSWHYKQSSIRQSLQWAYGMRDLLKFKSQNISERDLAYMIKTNEKHLENLLPYHGNKSYKSSYEKFQQIITRCSELLQPAHNKTF